MNFVNKLIKNVYLQQAALAVLSALLLIFVISILLNIFTRHGVSQPVPDFKGMGMESVVKLAEAQSLRIEVVDSVYRIDYPRGLVFDQNPKPNVQVKKNRKIFLTINSMSPKKEMVPFVEGSSLRQAKADLNARGFYVGTLNYVSDIATNSVLEQRYKGARIESGVLLPVGTEIDLQLGLDSTSARVTVPNVTGLTFRQAKEMLAENSLNCDLKFDRGVTTLLDSLNAAVYRQDPVANQPGGYGGRVQVFLKPQKSK